jgi:hypothetical protein
MTGRASNLLLYFLHGWVLGEPDIFINSFPRNIFLPSSNIWGSVKMFQTGLKKNENVFLGWLVLWLEKNT